MKREGFDAGGSLTLVEPVRVLQAVAVADPAPAGATDELYRDHAEFVWRTLQRMGIPHADVEDLMHEVFVVVHRRLAEFRGDARVTTWLFAICLRVAKRHRRRGWFRFERALAPNDDPITEQTPDRALETQERLRQLDRALSTLSAEHRAVFVLFELEGVSGDQIAEMTGIPIGTVYSRLHTARKRFARGLLHLTAEKRSPA